MIIYVATPVVTKNIFLLFRKCLFVYIMLLGIVRVGQRCDEQKGCDRHPSFGWKQEDGGKARRCGHHRLEGMESVKVKNRGKRQAAPLVLTGRLDADVT